MGNAQYIEADITDVDEYVVPQVHQTAATHGMESLIAALSDVSDTATVAIYRQNGNGQQGLIFLDSFPPDRFTPDDLHLHLKNTYGAGSYRVHVRDGTKLRANKLVNIGSPLSVSRETNNGAGDMRELMQFMQQQQQQMMQLMREQQKPAEDSEEKFLEKMLKYKQLFGGETQKTGGISELLGAVDALKLLGVNVGGLAPEPVEDGFSKIIESAAPVLTALLNRPQQPHQPQQRPQPQYKPNPAPREQDDMNLKVKLGVATLVRAAAKNADTAFYADFVFDQVPEETLRGIFAAPDIEGELAKINPDTLKYKDWFTDLGEHLRGMLGVESSKYFNDYNETDLQDGDGGGITPENDTE